DWTEKSLGRLAELMPGRYGKHEADSAFLTTLDGRGEGSQVAQALDPSGNAFYITDDMRADYEKAAGMLKDKQYEQGIAVLLKLNEQAPGLATVNIDLGIAYARNGDLEHAEASL